MRHAPALTREMALRQWRASVPAIDTATVRELGYGVATDERLRRSIAFVQEAVPLDRPVEPADIFAQGFMPE